LSMELHVGRNDEQGTLPDRPDCKRQLCRRHILAGSGIKLTDQ
jgi:hypothetical protein